MSLQDLLDERGLTQADVARRIGMAPDKLSKTISSKRRLTVSEAQALADSLGVPVERVLEQVKGGNAASARRPAVNGPQDATIEYTWPDGHRITVTSSRPFDATTFGRVERLIALSKPGD